MIAISLGHGSRVMSNEFAHGSYADYWGVVIHGVGADGPTTLEVSDSFFDPLMEAILDQAWVRGAYESAPRIAREWNECTGWNAAGAGVTAISRNDAEELVAALEDLPPETAEDDRRCAAAIRRFIQETLARGGTVAIADD